MKKVALITGVTGQDGAYLAEFLVQKGYVVHGIRRRSSLLNTERIDHLITRPQDEHGRLYVHYGDMTDAANLVRLVQDVQPDEIYNLAAQSHVHVSFDSPEYTANVDGLGALRLLEAIRILGREKDIRFYQASTSELFGKIQEPRQNEQTSFYPRSPYAVAKLYAYWITINYREAYGIYACNGILFNHESPIRGESFVTRKITRSLARIAAGVQDELFLGNLNSERDWGHAKDYVEMQWLMLQQEVPKDFVIATGRKHTVRQFIEFAANELGISLEWQGEGIEERGVVAQVDEVKLGSVLQRDKSSLAPGDVIIKIDPWYFRPTEVDCLLGDASMARDELGWEPKISLEEMVQEMVREDVMLARRDAHCVGAGYRSISSSDLHR